MKKRRARNASLDAKYYAEHGVLEEIIGEPVEMSLETELSKSILAGKRKKNLKSNSIKWTTSRR